MTKNSFFNLFSLSLIGVFYLLITNYEVFIYLIFVLSIIYFYYFHEYKDEKIIKIFAYFSVPCFYILKYIFSLSESFNLYWINQSQSSYSGLERFWDIQQFYFGLFCNSNSELNTEFNYYYFFGNSSDSCPFDIGWGPLANNLSANFNVWNATIATGLIVLIGLLILYFVIQKKTNDSFISSIIFLSPPINFLFERMNIDLIIFLILLLILKDVEKNYVVKSIIIFTLILIKIHPIGLIPGIMLFALSKKNKVLFYLYLSLGLASTFLLLTFSNSVNYINSKVYPNDFGRSFGLLNNYEILSFYNQEIGTKNSVIFLIFYASIFLLFAYKIIKNFESFKIEGLDYFIVSILSWILFISIFENFDYRLGFVILIANRFDLKNKFYLSLFLFIFVSPLNIFGIENLVSYNILFYIIKTFLFHNILLIIFLNLLKLIKSVVIKR